jgi:uncharacterized membrane-anchored protein
MMRQDCAMNPLANPIGKAELGVGIANVCATGVLWIIRVRAKRALSPRQAPWVVSSLLSVTISSLTYSAFLCGWLSNWLRRNAPGEFTGLTRVGTVSISLGLLTAGYAFFCTMKGDAESRTERIRIFIVAVIAGLLWLLVMVASSIPPV